jgi:hypothetical protein
MSDHDLAEFASAPVDWTTWAGHQQLLVGDVDVFVKRIPLTEPELAAPGATRNWFGLPCFYNYGVGSAGFGAYRELRAHEAANELVRSGVSPGFPLLYHHRATPRHATPPPFPIERSRYRARWNNNDAVERYIDARQNATYELWLFSEHVSDDLMSILRRAGLHDEPGVKPRSVTAWAGKQIFNQRGRIDDVAVRLGMRSLDRAARLIGWDWRDS